MYKNFRPYGPLKILAPAESLLASLALLLALLLDLVTFLIKELYRWSLEMVTQHQYKTGNGIIVM